MNVTSLRFEHRTAGEPALGLHTATPRLSWTVTDAADGYAQTGYDVDITRTPWGGEAATSTVSVEGDAQVLVDWPAEPLAARERVDVRVRVRSGEKVSDWSEAASAEVLLPVADWTARWISPASTGGLGEPAPAVRGSLDLPGEVVAARLSISAHGWYEAHLNGVRVGGDYFGPGWTAYKDRIRAYVYDVTDLVKDGANDLTVLLGNGWWRGELTWSMKAATYGDRLAALAQLDVLTADGQTHTLATDGSWTAHATHILSDQLYGGERQDLRLPLVADEARSVDVLDDTLDTLVGAEGPAVQVTGTLPALKVWQSPSGKTLVDFGQNLVGLVQLTVRGLDEGAQVVIKHAEVLEHDELGVRPLRHAKATDTYTLAGPDEVTLEPHFTFHGFRYAEVEGVADLAAADLEAVVLGSNMTRIGTFDSSHELINQLHSNVVWGMRGNFVDVPTDCPQRDERLGWTGDIQVFSPTALYLHDAAGFLSSWSRDLAADQREDGNVGIVVPDVLQAPFAAAAWGDAAVVVPWNIYRATADDQILRDQLASMKGWVDKIDSLAGDSHLWLGGFQFGDWLDPDAPPDQPAAAKADADIVATACFYHCADLTAQACAVVGDTEGETRYRELAEAIKTAFQRRFVTADGMIISDATTTYSMAIVWGLLKDAQRQLAGDRLADLVRLSGFKISTGFVGTPLITDALTLTGHADLAYRLIEETGCPSWLYPVTMGATTIWERWDSMLPDGTINPGEMTSFNHYALGAVADWLHRKVAGLDLGAPGYRVLRVAPEPGGSLTSATTSLRTPYGEASVGWTRDGEALTLDVTVPVGATAEIAVPGGETVTVGAGQHSFSGSVVTDEREIVTIRDLIDDREKWDAIMETALALPAVNGDSNKVVSMLRKALDQPAGSVAAAITAAGMMPGMEQLQQTVDRVLS